MTIINFVLMFLSLLTTSYCDELAENNSTILYFDDLDDSNSTLLNDLQELNRNNSNTVDNPILMASKKLEISSNITNKPPENEKTSNSKINQLLESIDDRLRNSSMLLDSHVLVVQKANGTVNLSRTWTFHPDKIKTSENRTFVAKIPLNVRPFRPHRRLSSHMSRFGQQTSYRRTCERLTDQQKYMRLQSVGGFNQIYMANSPVEASRNFPRLLSNYDDVPTSMFSDGTLFSDVSDANRPVDPNICDEQCEEIRYKLEEVLLDDNVSRFGRREMLFDDESGASEDTESMPETTPRPKRGRCRLERFIPIGNCTSRGEEEFWDYEKLCTACQGVYMLSKDCFPSFINSVVCHKSENRCIFDRYTGVSQGICKTKKLTFKVMRNRGSKECEEWEFLYIEIPIACECYLSKTSYLDSSPRN